MAWTTRMEAPFRLAGDSLAIVAVVACTRNEDLVVQILAVQRAGPHGLNAVPAGLRNGAEIRHELGAERHDIVTLHAGQALNVLEDAERCVHLDITVALDVE